MTKCVPFVIFVIQMVAHADGANIYRGFKSNCSI